MPSLGFALLWIAQHDAPTEVDAAAITNQPSIQLVASLFHKDPAKLADDIINMRAEAQRNNGKFHRPRRTS